MNMTFCSAFNRRYILVCHIWSWLKSLSGWGCSRCDGQRRMGVKEDCAAQWLLFFSRKSPSLPPSVWFGLFLFISIIHTHKHTGLLCISPSIAPVLLASHNTPVLVELIAPLAVVWQLHPLFFSPQCNPAMPYCAMLYNNNLRKRNRIDLEGITRALMC